MIPRVPVPVVSLCSWLLCSLHPFIRCTATAIQFQGKWPILHFVGRSNWNWPNVGSKTGNTEGTWIRAANITYHMNIVNKYSFLHQKGYNTILTDFENHAKLFAESLCMFKRWFVLSLPKRQWWRHKPKEIINDRYQVSSAQSNFLVKTAKSCYVAAHTNGVRAASESRGFGCNFDQNISWNWFLTVE